MVREDEIHLGDTVRFQFGIETVEGVVTEDIGPIGYGGRRLYGIKFFMGTEHEFPIELGAAEIEAVTKRSVPRRGRK